MLFSAFPGCDSSSNFSWFDNGSFEKHLSCIGSSVHDDTVFLTVGQTMVIGLGVKRCKDKNHPPHIAGGAHHQCPNTIKSSLLHGDLHFPLILCVLWKGSPWYKRLGFIQPLWWSTFSFIKHNCAGNACWKTGFSFGPDCPKISCAKELVSHVQPLKGTLPHSAIRPSFSMNLCSAMTRLSRELILTPVQRRLVY